MSTLEIPGYDVWGRVGEGGMSEVWLAKHRALAVPVIVKTLRAALQTGPDAAGRVLSEARLMARVSNPRIVRAYDAGITGAPPLPYLVQEYVDGLDLAEIDRRRRKALGVGLPLWLVCLVMRDVCEGLRAAHQAGVIHRDLKPSNIFGAADSGVRLGDFGIAVARTEEQLVSDSAGTLKFMAPEQLRGGELGRFTDVWGAAATACDLRYGYTPFRSSEHVLDPGSPPDLPPPRSPAEAYFQEVLRAMLAKDRAGRPADMTVPMHHFAMLKSAVPAPRLAVVRPEESTLQIGPVRLHMRVGDIATAEADAIVSSANYLMRMATGVGAALRDRGGASIEDEATRDGERPLGSCVRTGAGALRAKHVFHAVSAWNEVSCVGRAFMRALLLADEHRCARVAVPALGTGAAKIGTEMCATAMCSALRWHVLLGGTPIREVTVYLDSVARLKKFVAIAEEIFLADTVISRADVGIEADPDADAEAATCVNAESVAVHVGEVGDAGSED